MPQRTVSDVTMAFDDYPVPESRQIHPIELPPLAVHGTAEIDGTEYVVMTDEQFRGLETYKAASEANAEALRELSLSTDAMVQEIQALVRAGQQADRQAEIFRQLYVNEIEDARLQKLVSTGGLAILLLLFGIGSL